MGNFQTFAEFLKLRAVATSPAAGGYGATGSVGEPVTGGDPARQSIPGERYPVAERTIFRGMFKAVNPARPVSPLNSRSLASPFRKKFKSQIMGR